jgi:putative transcriptional regulator
MSYHYIDSGLDNIYLENGYTVHQTPYGEGVSIQDLDGLQTAIANWLVSLPKPLIGAELRFLRLEMERTQRDLANVLGESEQTVRRWEKDRNKPLRGSADRLLRVFYSEYAHGDGTIRKIVDYLAKLNQIEQVMGCFEDTETGWKVAA